MSKKLRILKVTSFLLAVSVIICFLLEYILLMAPKRDSCICLVDNEEKVAPNVHPVSLDPFSTYTSLQLMIGGPLSLSG